MPSTFSNTLDYSTPTSFDASKSTYSSIGAIQEVEDGENADYLFKNRWKQTEEGEIRGGILLDIESRRLREKRFSRGRKESCIKGSPEIGQVFEFGKETIRMLEDKENISGPSNAFIDCIASSNSSISHAVPAHDHRELLSLLSDISSISSKGSMTRSPGQTSINHDSMSMSRTDPSRHVQL